MKEFLNRVTCQQVTYDVPTNLTHAYVVVVVGNDGLTARIRALIEGAYKNPPFTRGGTFANQNENSK